MILLLPVLAITAPAADDIGEPKEIILATVDGRDCTYH